jgi:hypothetical protein
MNQKSILIRTAMSIGWQPVTDTNLHSGPMPVMWDTNDGIPAVPIYEGQNVCVHM